MQLVEAVVKVISTTGGVKGKTSASLWPWRDGAPVSVLVSDGKHQEGLVLFANQAASHTDRFIPMDTTNRFHTYRFVIHGTNMEMWVDGERKVEGQGACWKPADSPEAFVQFGSSAKTATGEAIWQSVKLGTRKAAAPLPASPLKVTVSERWDIPRDDIRQTRPYLYDMGQGLLLMSVAQGPDAFNADATSFEMIDNAIQLPKEFTNEAKGDQIICERHIWSDADGGKSWTKPVELEVGRVLPDLVLMSNGVLACSYGWPASCLMFSLDGGMTWPSHHVISEKVGFNYTSIREISNLAAAKPDAVRELSDAWSARDAGVIRSAKTLAK